MPQVLMLNHAAWVNRERSDRKQKAKAAQREAAEKQPIAVPQDEPMFRGKPISQLSSAEYLEYMNS